MYRVWTGWLALVLIGGCDGGAAPSAASGVERSPRLAGSYRVEQRCNGLGAATVDFTARDQGSNYYLLLRSGDGSQYAAVDHLALGPSWDNDAEVFVTASDGLPLYDWRAQLTKEAGWLKGDDGVRQLPDEASVAYDPGADRFFFESGCGEDRRAGAYGFEHRDRRLALHALNVAMAKARARLHRDAGRRYIDKRGEYLGRSGAEGVTEGHHDRNRHLLDVAALMKADAEENVPGLARLVAEQRPADAVAARRYRAELTAYLRAAAAAHARWYIDSADIRLDWFHGAYPEGEAAVREGMAALETAYLRLAE